MNPYEFGYVLGVKSAAGPIAAPAATPPPPIQKRDVFDAGHVAGVLGMRPNADPKLVYNRMVNMHKNRAFTPAQWSNLNQSYGNALPPFTYPQGAQQPAPAPPAAAAPPAAPPPPARVAPAPRPPQQPPAGNTNSLAKRQWGI